MSNRSRNIIVATLLLAHAGLLVEGARRNFVVLDEVGHVPSGLRHWRSGTFTDYQVNPPLARMLAALPLLLADPSIDLNPSEIQPGDRPEWPLGLDFIKRNPASYFKLVRLARVSTIAWSVLGGWLIGRWCRELYGASASCLAVALWCFDPTILAFAQVVTPDIPATTAGLAAAYSFWRFLRRPSMGWVIASGTLLGIAQLSKFTLIVFYAIWPFLALSSIVGIDQGGEPGSVSRRRRLILTLLILLLGVLERFSFD